MIRHSLINRENWDKTAVIDENQYISYRNLTQKAIAIKEVLDNSLYYITEEMPPAAGNSSAQSTTNYQAVPKQQMLIKKVENVAIFLPNGVNYIAALFGVMMSGMTAFPLNIRLTIHEIAPLLAQASVHTVITSKAYHIFFEDILKTVPVRILYVEDLPECIGSKFYSFGHTDVDNALRDNNLYNIDSKSTTNYQAVPKDEPMILLTTSGTTGNAKIVQLSEHNVASSTFAYLDKMDFEKIPEHEIRLVLGTPFSSVYALMVLTACIIKSIPIVVLKETFTLDMLYKTAQQHRVTHFEGGVSVGLLMEQMAGRPVSYDISSFRYFGLAGSKISSAALRRLTEAYPGVEFWPGYGMTEAGPLIAKPDKKVNMDKLDSVGTAIDCVTIMVAVNGVLSDAPHTIGEIVVKGPNVMIGYYKNEEETSKILKDGYLYTGDIGYFDEDGDLYICGRRKNVIIVRGFNVYAEEVEACILNSGLVTDCIVYGETDPLGNEVLCSDIIPRNKQVQTDDIRSYCKEHLANYKQPQRIILIDKIRKTATGKTERAEKKA